MAAQLIRDRVEMECLEGAWETLEGNTRCRFRGTIRFTATSLVHPDEPARTLQHTVEWILPTPTPYRLVEPIPVIEVTSSEEDPEEDLEELPPEPAVDALDFLEGDEDPLLEVDSPEEVMSASEADSTEDSGPGEMAPHNFQTALSLSLTLPFSSSSFSIEAPSKASTFGHHFCPKSRKEDIFGVVKCMSTSGTSKFQLVLCECCITLMLGKLGRIDGDPVLRETRIWATWEYVSSVGGGQQGMSGTWRYVAGGQETLETSGGVLLPKTKLDQSRPNPGIVGQLRKGTGTLWRPLIVMAAQLIRDRVEMECLEGAWETLEGNTRCRFRGTIRFTATSLVHPDEPARTLQHTVEWILPTPTPYRLVEPIPVIEVTSSKEDPEEDLEELPPEPAVDALDFLEGDEDPLLEVDSPEEVMSASEADSTEDSGPGEMAPPTRHPLDPDKSNRALGFPAFITGLCQSFGVPVTPTKVIRPPITWAFIEKYCTARQAQGGYLQAPDAPPPPPQADPAGSFGTERYLRHLVRQQAANHRAHVQTHDSLYQLSLSLQSQGFASFPCPTPDQFRAEVAWPGDWPEAQAGEAPAEAPGEADEVCMDEEMTDLLDFLGGSRAT
ncbi:hypothetical protein HKD37_17G048576 [Glycine soja]